MINALIIPLGINYSICKPQSEKILNGLFTQVMINPKYIFLRESYLQRRAKMVTDGKDVQDFEIDVLEINY